MKKIILSVLVLIVATLVSCRKNDVDQDIKQYDDEQIQNFIKTNGITGMQKDASGVYYKILSTGSADDLKYSDSVSFVFTLHTFDGRYASVDTLSNHYTGYLGRLQNSGYPAALQTAIFELAKKYGTRIRLLVPSNLGYGTAGVGQGSSTTNNTRIYGNQCLDYYINIMKKTPADQKLYDDMVIRNYMTANGITDYQKTASGLYYKILRPGVSSTPVTDNSTVNCNYTFSLLNGYIFDQFNGSSTGTPLEVPELVAGVKEALTSFATVGTNMSVLIPSSLAYGTRSSSSPVIPGNSCVRFDVQVFNVTP